MTRPLTGWARTAGLCAGLCLALDAPAAAAHSRWLARVWQTEDGLPNNTVVGIVQTPDGYLWLGTPTGLVRFDGGAFESFSSTNFVEAPNRGILSMAPSREGGLHLAMDRSALVLLQPGSARVFLPGKKLPDEVPFAMAQDAQGQVWVSYRDGSVCRISHDQVARLTRADGVEPSSAMCALASDEQGRIWWAKDGALGRVEQNHFQTLEHIPANPVRLAAGGRSRVWICSASHLWRWTPEQRLESVGDFSATPSDPSALLEDHADSIWIGTDFSGLFHFDGAGFEAVPTSNKAITSLARDHEGNIWVGTIGGGLNQIRPRIVELEGTEDGLPFDAVHSLCETPDGAIWAATQNGVVACRRNERWQVFAPEPAWTSAATCLTADASGAIWIGTRQQGLFCWKDNQFQAWGNANQLRGKTVHALHASRAGDLWIGEDTPLAVQRLRQGELKTFDVPREELRVIRAMAEGADGSIWLGTSRGLLLHIQGDSVKDETSSTTGSPASIRCLYTTSDGTLWIGYAGWGVGRLRNGQFTNLRSDQGLFDDYISHIVADDRGWIWFGGDRGIFKVRLQEFQDLAEGRANRVHSIHYGRSDGLPSLQANFGGAPDALRTHDGRVWIPMRTGLAVVNPSRQQSDSPPPPVLLHRVLVDEKPVAARGGLLPAAESHNPQVLDLNLVSNPLRLPPSHRRVYFEFAALSFAAPENVHFRYRLDPFDDDWVDASTVHNASYSRLPAGQYLFRVIACNSDGVWNETGASLPLIVLPFFWQTLWFRTLTLSGFSLLLVALVRYVSFRRLRRKLRRFEQQEALHKERARIAKDIHDDVGANLTQIALLGDLTLQDAATPERTTPRLETISRTARLAVKSLDEIVWAVNPRNDTLAHLIDYTGQYALDYLRVAGIRCRLDLPELPPARPISTDVRHNLFLVVKEALNNIVKHAQATEVWLRIRAEQAGLHLSVEDNGRGFSGVPGDAGADGLHNMRQRVQEIGGQYRMESQPGQGTRIVVDLPWPPVQD